MKEAISMANNPDRIHTEYRIRLNISRPDPATYKDFKDFPAAAISDSFRKRQTLPPDVKPVYPGMPKIVGPAITAHVTPGDELLALKAIEIAQPGDVIVVAGARSPRFSLWGGIMSLMAKTKGVAALITDGMIRDVEDIEAMGFPIYATGVTPVAPVMDIPPGELNLPITFGDVVIEPGDLIVADWDGVVAVPQRHIEAVDVAIRARLEKEAAWEHEIRTNKTDVLKDTVDALLAQRTVEYLD